MRRCAKKETLSLDGCSNALLIDRARGTLQIEPIENEGVAVVLGHGLHGPQTRLAITIRPSR
jgi:hypothetical protein